MAGEFPLDLSVLSKVLDYLNDAVYVTDRDRRILLWNRRAEEITGYARGEVVGRSCRESILNHVDKDGRPLCSTDLCPLHRAIAKDAASNEPIVVYAMTAHGNHLPVSVSVAPLHDDGGEVVGGIEIFRDESVRLRDLEFARRVQRNLFTTSLPRFETLDFGVQHESHDMVGGDFFEIIPLAPETAAIFVADVRGHGVSAALYTTVLKTVSQSARAAADAPAVFLSVVNQALSRMALDEVFATAVYVLVDGRTGAVRYAGAGHPAPLIIPEAGEAREFVAGGMPLGFAADEAYDVFEARLDPGDTMLLFTDGATEVTGPADAMLGSEGLAALARKTSWSPAAAGVDALHAALVAYSGNVTFGDDLLLIACRRCKERAPTRSL